MEVFDNSEIKDEIIPKKQKKNCISKKQLINISIIIPAVIISAILLIVHLSRSSNKPKEGPRLEIFGYYRIYNSFNETPLLSEDYENVNRSIINIDINGTMINYTKKYKFPENGLYPIKFLLNKTIYMKNMFKNIQSLSNVEIYSNIPDTKIMSIEGAF